MREVANLIIIIILLFCGDLYANNTAPVTKIQNITNAVPGTPNVPLEINVYGFTDIGEFSLRLRFDVTNITYVSAVPNPLLPGMTVDYTPPSTGYSIATIIMEWSATSNHTLPDGAVLATLSFNYISGTGILNWSHSPGVGCRYRRHDDGSLITLDHTPRYIHYVKGGIANRGAPVTFAPTLTNVSPGNITIPIYVTQFTNIRSFTLYLEYDPQVITYQNSFTPNPAFTANFGVGTTSGTNGKMYLIIQWYTLYSVTLPPMSILGEFVFNYSNTHDPITSLKWFDNGPSCKYVDDNNDELLDYPTSSYYINGQIGKIETDIVLNYEGGCGDFSVNLKPLSKCNSTLTHLNFTVRWNAVKESGVQLTDINYIYPGLQQIGPRVLHTGYYYVTFSSNTDWQVNWAANTEYPVMTFKHSGNGSGNVNFTIIQNNYSSSPPGNNSAFRVDIESINSSNNIINNASGVNLNCGVSLKAFLQGPYDCSSGLMGTELVNNNFVPLSQPYNTTPWHYNGIESVTAYPANMVDWVLVELRSSMAHETVLERRAAIILNNGDVTCVDGVSPVVFRSFTPGNSYYIVLYHRCHLPVMTASAVSLPNTPATGHDFTIDPALNVFSNNYEGVIEIETNVYGMITGDINHDNALKYTGQNNDRLFIFTAIQDNHPNPPVLLNSTISGYYNEDLNMDGFVKYTGGNNDRSLILTNISTLTSSTNIITTYEGQVPVSY